MKYLHETFAFVADNYMACNRNRGIGAYKRIFSAPQFSPFIRFTGEVCTYINGQAYSLNLEEPAAYESESVVGDRITPVID